MPMTDTGCAECNRRELAVHVAKVDLESAERSIRALQDQVKALKARLEKKKGKGQDDEQTCSDHATPWDLEIKPQ
jgi:multidrug resistance efflux pump